MSTVDTVRKHILTYWDVSRVYIADFSGITKEELEPLKHLTAWLERIKARPAVQRGLNNYKKPE